MSTLPETLGCSIDLILLVIPLKHALDLRVDGSGI